MGKLSKWQRPALYKSFISSIGGLIKNKIKKPPFEENLASLTDVGHTSSMQLHYYNVIVMYILLVSFSV